MRIHDSLTRLPPLAAPTHLALGVFDGVHLGHQKIIGDAVRRARDAAGTAAVLTFAPHPSRVLTPAAPAPLIQTLAARAARIAALGVDELIVQPFTPEFSEISAPQFLRRLCETLGATARAPLCLHAGENFRFGHGGIGDFREPATFRVPAEHPGLAWEVAPGVAACGQHVSSTRIRELLAAGDITLANALLGWNYESRARAIAGRALGRTLGFPTLNMPWTPELLPRFGAYAVRLFRDGTDNADNGGGNNNDGGANGGGGEGNGNDSGLNGGNGGGAGGFIGVANYGLRPTVESGPVSPLLEVHLLGSAGTAAAVRLGPGSALRVEWHAFLRPEQKFPSLDALLAQIQRDAAAARAFFGE